MKTSQFFLLGAALGGFIVLPPGSRWLLSLAYLVAGVWFSLHGE